MIEIVIAEIDEEGEYENALEFATRKLRSVSRFETEVIYRRVHSALMRKGYGSSLINRVLRELDISPR